MTNSFPTIGLSGLRILIVAKNVIFCGLKTATFAKSARL